MRTGSGSIAVLLFVAGCSGSAVDGVSSGPAGAPAADAVVRSTPVIAGRPARVFVFAGLGDTCEPIAAPQISIAQEPAKGAVSLVPGQATTIQYASKGNCIGQKAIGTGVYYTARAGQTGVDKFAVTAKLPGKEAVIRNFEVSIAE